MAETIKNVVAAVNEGAASVAARAQEALGTVHDKASESAQTGPQKVDEVGGSVSPAVAHQLSVLPHPTHALPVPPPHACMQMVQSAAETRVQAADKATELKDKAADKAGEVGPVSRKEAPQTLFWHLCLAASKIGL